jgi:2'-5' RNA ligase
VTVALVLTLDEEADARVRAVWRDLDASGVPSLASVAETAHEPHVTLTVISVDDPDSVTGAIRDVAPKAAGLRLSLSSLGFFFQPDQTVAYLGVTPSLELLEVHDAITNALSVLPERPWEYYRPGEFVAHCTLAMGVDDIGIVPGIVARHELPIEARATQVLLVEVPSGRQIARLA